MGLFSRRPLVTVTDRPGAARKARVTCPACRGGGAKAVTAGRQGLRMTAPATGVIPCPERKGRGTVMGVADDGLA